ncbi:sensor histidine kinase [Roseomonas mucosa]
MTDDPLQDGETIQRRLADLERENEALRRRLAKPGRDARNASRSAGAGAEQHQDMLTTSRLETTAAIEEIRRAREAEERLRLIMESATEYAIFTMDWARRLTSWNAGAQRLFGYGEAEILGQPGDILFTPEDREQGVPQAEVEKAFAEGRATNDRWHMRKDGTRFWGSGLVMLLRDPGSGTLKIMRDTTERQRGIEKQRLLIGELNHRVKNILMNVQSLTSLTLRNSDTLDAFVTALHGRLNAIARAHDLLTSTVWEGADMVDIARAALAPWIADGHISLSGPPVHLQAQRVLPMSMALHELATNALKHGALSVPGGRVALNWRHGSAVEVEWQESGGPPVSPPTRQGFGSRVLNRALAAELDGAIDLRFEPTGVTCLIRFDLGATPPARFRGVEE